MAETDPLASLNVSVPRADQQIENSLPALNQASYEGVDAAVRGLTKVPGLTETILPSIKALLQPGADNPYAKLIDADTQKNVAAAQTDAMKRGLTGSDIEAASMGGARAAGESAKSQFYAQNASTLAGFVKDLATGDINAQRENLTMMAQLMGQKITSDQDLQMFREMLSANLDMASKNRQNELWGAGIGALGSIGGMAAGAAILSDRRLKCDIKRLGVAAGVGIYAFRWTPLAQAFGAHDRVQIGVMAQEIHEKYPEAAMEVNGWKAVNYSKVPSSIIESIDRLGAAHA